MAVTPALRLVAVVVPHNRRDQLRITLERLLQSAPDVLAAIVVCDNASSDGTAQDLAAHTDPRVHVVTLDDNLGGAGGFNAGMRAAMAEHSPDWIVLMDDDGRPKDSALAAFHATQRDTADVWAGATTYPNGDICEMNRPWMNPFASFGGFLVSLVKGRSGYHLGNDAYSSTALRAIDGASFVGVFIAAKTVEKHGYPDPALFLYGDDVLYTLGLSQAGETLMFDPSMRFEHDCETLTENSAVMRPLWKVYFFHRNQILVYRRAAGPVLFWPVFALRFLQWRLRAKAYGDDRKQYLLLLKKATRDGLCARLGATRADIEALLSR